MIGNPICPICGLYELNDGSEETLYTCECDDDPLPDQNAASSTVVKNDPALDRPAADAPTEVDWPKFNDEQYAELLDECDRIKEENEKLRAEVERLRLFEPYGAIQIERQSPSAVWICIAKVNGKREVGFSFDGAISPAYRQFVPAEELKREREAGRVMREALEQFAKPSWPDVTSGTAKQALSKADKIRGGG